MTIVRGIQADELESFWPTIAPFIERAIRRCWGDYSLAEIRASLLTGNRQLFVTWPECDAAGLTAIETRGANKILLIFAFAGQLPKDWRDIMDSLTDWARQLDCTAIELHGRKGWKRLLPDWREAIILRKELR